MQKRTLYIILGLVVVLIMVVAGFLVLNNMQQDGFLNFKDPNLTNEELNQVDQRIVELENLIKDKQKTSDLTNLDQKQDLFKLNMEISAQYRLRGRLLDAKKSVLDASVLLPENISPWNELYVIETARGDYKSAEQALLKSFTLNPANHQAWRWYLELASGPLQFSPDKLDSLYKEALEKTSHNVDLVVLYAVYLEKKNDLVGAVAQWRLAQQINPEGELQYQAEIARIQNLLN